jgi:hypothetical protein
MRFRLGAPPEDPEFEPERDGWVAVREPPPVKLQLIAIPPMIGVALLFHLMCRLAGVDTSALTRIRNVPVGLAIAVVIAPFHEFLHLLCLPAFGLTAESTVGFWPKMFAPYVQHCGALSRNRALLIWACPFVVISVVPLLVCLVKPDIPVIIVAVSYVNCLLRGGDLFGAVLVFRQVPSGAVVRLNGVRGYWRK